VHYKGPTEFNKKGMLDGDPKAFERFVHRMGNILPKPAKFLMI
jgi:hypothetical protein